MAGRPPKPLAIHEVTGSKRKNPARFVDRVEPETPGPIGDPPARFMPTEQPGEQDAAGNWVRHPSVYDPSDRKEVRALWYKLIAEAPIGLLTASDAEYLAAVCEMGIDARRPGKGQRQARKEYGQMLKGLGMTPEGRAIRGLGGKASAPERHVDPLKAYVARRAARAG